MGLLYWLNRCSVSHMPGFQVQGEKYSTPFFINSPMVDAYHMARVFGSFWSWVPASDKPKVTPLLGPMYWFSQSRQRPKMSSIWIELSQLPLTFFTPLASGNA